MKKIILFGSTGSESKGYSFIFNEFDICYDVISRNGYLVLIRTSERERNKSIDAVYTVRNDDSSGRKEMKELAFELASKEALSIARSNKLPYYHFEISEEAFSDKNNKRLNRLEFLTRVDKNA